MRSLGRGKSVTPQVWGPYKKRRSGLRPTWTDGHVSAQGGDVCLDTGREASPADWFISNLSLQDLER